MGRWEILTWGQYRDQVLQAARGLMNLGIEPGDGMAILGDNCPGWLLSHFAAIAAGGIPAGIYTNNTPEQCTLIADHCDAVVAFIENEELLESFLDSRARLSHLRVIVLMDGDHPDPGVISWQDLLDQGSQVAAASLRQRLDAVDPHGVCELIYTSGTTGRPKGVMLTHHNVIWTADRLTSAYDIGPADSLISYLPLSHIAEQIFSLYAPVFTGACVWFAESLDKVGENLREVRPHFFFAVPRVWEKIHMRITSAAARSSARERRIAAWAQHKGLEGGYAEQQGRSKALLYGLADKLVLNKVRQRLGLDRARGCFSAAAPISIQTLEFFLSLGIPILEIYGMSENTGPATLSTRGRYRTGKAGWPMDGTELKIEADGEICMRGPHISPGYFKDPAATRETFDGQGWLHSGDIGEIDDQGFLSITDRKKELIITSGGKNVGPQAIENELRRIEVVGQAVVIGDRQKYLAALLTLDPEALPRVAARVGSPARDLSAAASCPVLRSHLESQVEEVNAGLARFKTIKRFTILPVELSVRGGEMTPTMKLKRRFVNEKYAKEIEELYL
jgi:long-subunit acyl-CoA synthetase (AMP-forming)